MEINGKDDMSVREWVASSWSEIEREHRCTRGDYQLHHLLTTSACTNTKERKVRAKKKKRREKKEKKTSMGNIDYRYAPRKMPTPPHLSESIENVERGVRSCVRV